MESEAKREGEESKVDKRNDTKGYQSHQNPTRRTDS